MRPTRQLSADVTCATAPAPLQVRYRSRKHIYTFPLDVPDQIQLYDPRHLHELCPLHDKLSPTIIAMAGIPPQLPLKPVTPSSEWAATTTSALKPDAETSNVASINPTTRQLFEEKNMRPGSTATETFSSPLVTVGSSTPGREVPGAYPATPGDETKDFQTKGQQLTSQAADAAVSVAHTVQGAAATYLPMAAETVGQYLPKGMADTLASYIRP